MISATGRRRGAVAVVAFKPNAAPVPQRRVLHDAVLLSLHDATPQPSAAGRSAARRPARLTIDLGDGRVVSAELSPRAARSASRAVETGEELALLELDAELSTTEAARLLGMSRPTLIKLLDHEVIPSRREGRDRRVKLSDIVAYQQRRDLMSSARESFTRMAERHPEFFAGGVEADAEFDPSAMEPAG